MSFYFRPSRPKDCSVSRAAHRSSRLTDAKLSEPPLEFGERQRQRQRERERESESESESERERERERAGVYFENKYWGGGMGEKNKWPQGTGSTAYPEVTK